MDATMGALMYFCGWIGNLFKVFFTRWLRTRVWKSALQNQITSDIKNILMA